MKLIVTRTKIRPSAGDLMTCDLCEGAIVKIGVLVNTRLPDGSPLSHHRECAECYSRVALTTAYDAVTDADLDALTLAN